MQRHACSLYVSFSAKRMHRWKARADIFLMADSENIRMIKDSIDTVVAPLDLKMLHSEMQSLYKYQPCSR